MARAVLLLAAEALRNTHQLSALLAYCRAQHHEIMGMTQSIFAAFRMIENDEVDVVVMPPDAMPFKESRIEIARDDGDDDAPRRPRLI